MKNYIYILTVLLIISCDSLHEETYKFNIKNESNHTLYFYEATINNSNIYPDTLLTETKQLGVIRPMSALRLGGFQMSEALIEELPSDTLSIYFFHTDTLDLYSWNEIRENYTILKRYDISVQDYKR